MARVASTKRLTAAILTAALALALCALLAGCSDSGIKADLPAWADEATLAQDTQAVIEDFSARDYEAVAALGQRIGITAPQLQAAGDPVLDALGALESFGDAAFMNGVDEAGNSYAIVVQMADYTNGTAQYTVSFYEDGSLAGFYVK